MRLRSRFAVGSAALVAASIVMALGTAYVLVHRELVRQLDGSLRTRAASIARVAPRLSPAARRSRRTPGFAVPPARVGEATGYVQFVAKDGKVTLIPGEHVRLPASDALAVARGTRPPFFIDTTVAGAHLRIYVAPAGTGAVEVARSLSDVDGALHWIRLLFISISAIAIAAAGALALLVARAVLRPVTHLTADVERITTTRDLNSRTDDRRTDELGRLARAFNAMLQALRESLTAQRQLVADASHELRTPLTTANTNLEILERHPDLDVDERMQSVHAARRELGEMTHLIDELVALARGDANRPELEPVQLDEIAADAVSAAERRIGHRFRTTLRPSTVLGATGDLTRAIANLLDNAVKWSPPHAPIDVLVADGTVAIRDRGPGVPPEDRAHIFDRFYRAAGARTLPGSGLGLAIVRQVAEAHGGSVSIAAPDDGGTL
ncbi:MAG TPA: HAMP domain-containing sensor histidine kinase, partial [Gaiellaceae bacterium]